MILTRHFSHVRVAASKPKVITAPGLEQHRDKAEQALLTYLNRYGGGDIELKAAAARYEYTLEDVREYWSDVTYRFRYRPVESNRRGRDEILGPEDERRQFYPDSWSGHTGRRVYPTPKDAIEDIPQDSGLGWRGMSWEEWRMSERRGFIQSVGQHNFLNQEGLTFYGYTPDTAAYYAGSFAPAAYKAGPIRPGIVIGVPRQELMDHKEDAGIPQGELAHRGPLSLSKVEQVYMLVTVTSKPGTVELIVNYQGKVSEGSRSDISMGYAIRHVR
jgi:hypothetical protein